ncbi:hypothetical protein B0O99DRAFT_516550 [Bisporella sp. PMI_857]|nr:hypothetical protein B0O99DRAFT_516550 [Bisporella sp. PMI_857]
MPRDLEGEKPSVVPLTESPNRLSQSPTRPGDSEQNFVILPYDEQKTNQKPNLNPYTRPLTVSDIDSVEALENAAFSDPRDRATREKLLYRLSKCGELCLGIFITIVPGSDIKAETLATGKPVETTRENGAISVLVGHIVSTKATTPLVTDVSMDYPKDWNSEKPVPSELGHQEDGRTIVLHSVAVLPEFQGGGLGRILMLAYMQQMNGAGIADRLALIAHDHMVPWYQKLGWNNKGKSNCQFGGGGWSDMAFDLKAVEARAAYG